MPCQCSFWNNGRPTRLNNQFLASQLLKVCEENAVEWSLASQCQSGQGIFFTTCHSRSHVWQTFAFPSTLHTSLWNKTIYWDWPLRWRKCFVLCTATNKKLLRWCPIMRFNQFLQHSINEDPPQDGVMEVTQFFVEILFAFAFDITTCVI